MRLIRVGFSKQAEACYISHLDLQRVIQRALKIAQVPVWYTQGFNPHIYLTFALPLSLGQSSVCESFDYKCEEDAFDPEQVKAGLNLALPRGIEVYRVQPAVMDPNQIEYARYQIEIEGPSEQILKQLVSFCALPEAVVYKKTKKGEPKPLNLLSFVREWQPVATERGVQLNLVLPAGNRLNINPELLCEFLCSHYDMQPQDIQICRVGVYNAQMEDFV